MRKPSSESRGVPSRTIRAAMVQILHPVVFPLVDTVPRTNPRGNQMPDKPRQIIAMGGGGFSMEPENLTLDRYVLAQAGLAEPRVSFLPTASGDVDSYAASFYTAFARLPCQPSHLMFFRRTPDLREHVLSQDVIYVGGGNTKSMLGVWREWGLPEILREAWEAGVVLAGVSAGCICWFEQGLTDSFEGD